LSGDLVNFIVPLVAKRIDSETGLAHFVRSRLQFEGWLKVVLVTEISKIVDDVEMHIEYPLDSGERIDIVISKVLGIELKIIATNFRDSCVCSKNKNITNQVDSLIGDLRKLAQLRTMFDGMQVASFGLAFPVRQDNLMGWNVHVNRVLEMGRRFIPSLDYSFEFVNLPCSESSSTEGVVFLMRSA